MDAREVDYEDPETHELIEGSWKSQVELPSLTSRQRYNASQDGKILRNQMREYVNSPVGAVPWQESRI